MPDYYDFDDLKIEEETEGQKRIKRVLRTVLGLLLITLFIIFLIPLEIPASFLEGKEIQNHELIVGNITIVFEENSYEKLKQVYFENQLTEIKFCLTGTISNNTYYIHSLYAPTTYFATPISVSSQGCNQETIISLHTHPLNNCLFSQQDILSHNSQKRSYPKMLSAVMCATNRFAIYH